MAKAANKVVRGTKSEAIRQLLREYPNAKTGEIAEMLNQRGIKVSAQYVSNMRTKMNRYGIGRRAIAPITVEDLERIKEIAKEAGGFDALNTKISQLEDLAKRVGGIERLKRGLQRLESLRA